MGLCINKQKVYPDDIKTILLPYSSNRELVIICDHEFRIIHCNRKTSSTLGYPNKELIGRFIWNILSETDKERYKEIFSITDVSIKKIIRIQTKDAKFLNALYKVEKYDKCYNIVLIPFDTPFNPHIPQMYSKYINVENSTAFNIESQEKCVCMRIGMLHENTLIQKFSSSKLLTHLQSILFLMNKDILREFSEYMYISIPEDLHFYISFNVKFKRLYKKFASLSYTVATRSVRDINNYFELKNIPISVSASLSIGTISYGVINNRSFQIFGPVKKHANDLFTFCDKNSIIMSEDLYELMQEENTHTQVHVDINELTNMSPFYRCKVDIEENEYKNMSTNKILMKFLNITA